MIASSYDPNKSNDYNKMNTTASAYNYNTIDLEVTDWNKLHMT